MELIIIGSGRLSKEFIEWFDEAIEVIAVASNNQAEFHNFQLPGKL